MNKLQNIVIMLVIKCKYKDASWIFPAIFHATNAIGTNPYQFYEGASKRQWVCNNYDMHRLLQHNGGVSTTTIV